MEDYKTDQERFWAGEFGNNYIKRNQEEKWVASNIALFAKILADAGTVHSAIEFGANIGINLQAIKSLLPECELSAIEINQKAVNELKKLKEIKIYAGSILDFYPDYTRDLVFTKGVLIHIDPDSLMKVYDLLYETSKRYICVVEYYNPTPVEITYRGHVGKLFKRDFAGDMLDRFKDLKLVRYGFVYHRDNLFPDDDLTWFLLEKK